MTGLVWLRRDLRLADHPALSAALAEHDTVACVFVLDDVLLSGRFASAPRTRFLLESLAELDGSLRERGGGLVVRRGNPAEVVPALVRELGAERVHVSGELTPYARRRDAQVGAQVLLTEHPGVTVVDDVTMLRTKAGTPFQRFTPFYRRWLESARRPVLEAPSRVPLPAGLDPGVLPELPRTVADPAAGGERLAHDRLEDFLERDVHGYAAGGQDDLAGDRTSRLSPYLHLGCLSSRQVEARLPDGPGPEAFARQLAFRDFYLAVLADRPEAARLELQERFRALPWRDDPELLAAWQDGRTGHPLVDAGMRQLRREGWMHNRARLVVGSFLTKDLGIDWRAGEAWFMRWLLDGDEASNNGNWQWVTSVGADPQPVSRRLYHPARQQERFDPTGAYVRRYVPELADVPDRFLAEPWTMPADVQRRVGCLIGRDYPAPVVDHAGARRAALARFRDARG